jgi:aminoglycoside phosphotransferase family enzyme/predicted kinase
VTEAPLTETPLTETPLTETPGTETVIAFLTGLAEDGERETHISRVFLGRDTAWKLKKPVRLAFLDFSTPAARRHFLLRELALNARTTAGLYRDVVPVILRPDGSLGFGTPEQDRASGAPPSSIAAGARPAGVPSAAPRPDAVPAAPSPDVAVAAPQPAPASAAPQEGEILDWVLRMARVPDADFFDRIIARGGVTPLLLDRTADAIAALHAALPPAPPGAGQPMQRIADGNALAARLAGIPAEPVQAWAAAMRDALAARAEWQAARQRDGFVRRGHGDLHLGNLCLWQGAPAAFDALEFDETLATTDLGYDLAFLLMDLQVRLGRSAANRVLNRYVARTGDAGLLVGLAPFLSMRAMVRAHVQASRGEDFARYLDLALTALRPPPPVLVAIGGLPGTGKSTLARALAPDLGATPGALVLRSDEIRKRLAGVAPEARLAQDAYGDTMNARVNATLLAGAAQALAGGQAVIADATFLDPAQRAAIAAVAAQAGRAFLGLWLTAPLELLEARVAARHGDASDATPSVLAHAAKTQGPPPDAPWLRIAAEDSGRALGAALAALRAHATPC